MGATQLELSLVARISKRLQIWLQNYALDALIPDLRLSFDMLATAGLSRNDVEFVAVGATAALAISAEGVHAATLTIELASLPHLAALTLAKSTEPIPNIKVALLPAGGFIGGSNKAAVFEAYLDGLDWVLDPANDADARTILSSRMPQIKPKAMDAVMKSLTSPESGLTPHGAVLPKGMDQVIALRSNYGGGTAPLEPANAFMDLHIYQQIMKSRI